MNEKTVNIGQVYLCFLSSDAFVEKQYLFQNDACFQGFRFIVFDSRQIPYFHRSREDLNWNKFRKNHPKFGKEQIFHVYGSMIMTRNYCE